MVSPLSTASADRSGTIVSEAHDKARPAGTAFWALTIGTIGVLYGDIGTRPALCDA